MQLNLAPSLNEKCQFLEIFWSIVCPNVAKYGPEKLQIRALFMESMFPQKDEF